MVAIDSIKKPPGVTDGRSFFTTVDPCAPPWGVETVSGRLVELCGDASSSVLTVAVDLILKAQEQGRLVAWITGLSSTVYPPDLAESGIELQALPFIRADTPRMVTRSADTLIRSKAFAFVVLEVASRKRLSLAIQTRFISLTKNCGTGLVLLSRTSVHTGNSLVSLRILANKSRHAEDVFMWRASAIKDKRSTPGWSHEGYCSGTSGLC